MTTLSSICYHYIARDDEFKRIWGHSFELFKKHINFFQENYSVIDAKDIVKEKFEVEKKYMLLTFDDGLKEHLKISKYLESLGMKGVFSVPTCILRGEPANPQVIHFGLAYYGVRKFYSFLEKEIKSNFPMHENLLIKNPKQLELMELHKNLKVLFKSQLDHLTSRAVLLNVYNQIMKKDFPNLMDIIHLSKEDIIEMAKNGHTIAVHTDTHPVVRDIENNQELMLLELVQSRQDLASLTKEEITTFTYPFGAATEILDNTQYFTDNQYKLILTTFKQQENFDPLNLGRYLTFSQDTTDDLLKNLWHYTITE